MRRRSRTRQVLKWVGLVGCVLALAAWGVSCHGVGFTRTTYAADPGEPPPARSLRILAVGLIDGFAYIERDRFPVKATFVHPQLKFVDPFTPWTSWASREEIAFRSQVNSAWPRWRPSVFRLGTSMTLSTPLWLVVVVFAAYPVIIFMQGSLQRLRRRRKGLCVTCEYDLTGNISGVCPECGTPIGGRS